MTRTIDTLLLLALPASGKSELRRYLAHLEPQVAVEDLHLGPTVQLDDYPYVHMMRRIAQELTLIDGDPVFFTDDASSFAEPRDWGTLIQLLNEDYELLGTSARASGVCGPLVVRASRSGTSGGRRSPSTQPAR